MAYCAHKWDIKKIQPKHSGDSVDDVIEYVRRWMYNELVKPKVKYDESMIDSESADIIEKEEKASETNIEIQNIPENAKQNDDDDAGNGT